MASSISPYLRALERRRLYRTVHRLLAEGEARARKLSGGAEIRRLYGTEATRHLRSIVRLGGQPRIAHLVVMLRETIWREAGK